MRGVFYLASAVAAAMGSGVFWYSYSVFGRNVGGLVIGGLCCGLVCGLFLAFGATDAAWQRHKAAQALAGEMGE